MKKKYYTLLIILFVSTIDCIAQDIEWVKTLGGSGFDRALDTQQTTDGGYIIAGRSNSNDGDLTGNNGGLDYWIVKVSSDGTTIQWEKNLGGSNDDMANSIQQTTDGGFIVGGRSQSNDGDITNNNGGVDFWVLKLSSTGSIQWETSLGTVDYDYGDHIQETTDGGYIIGGTFDGNVTGINPVVNFLVIKLSSTGAIEWQNDYGGTIAENLTSLTQTNDGGYILSGNTSSSDGDLTGNNGNTDAWIVKLSSTGVIEWQKNLGGTSGESANSIIQTTDGGYIFTGGSSSNNGDATSNNGGVDFWVVKLSSVGAIEWQNSYGGSQNDASTVIKQTDEGGYLVAGQTLSNNGDVAGYNGGTDGWIIKLSSTGVIEWQRTVGGSNFDSIFDIDLTTDGGFVVVGQSTSTNGDITSNQGSSDYYIMKFDSVLSVDDFSENINIALYPNPTTGKLHIESKQAISQVIVYNLMGQQVKVFDMQNDQKSIDMNELKTGSYFVNVQNTSGKTYKKFIVKK